MKESLFNIIQFDIEGRRVLDLFAGTGQLGIECLSRGADSVVFIDQSREAVKIIKENLKACGLSAPVLQQEALSYLHGCGSFDLIFVDPPYDSGLYEPVLNVINSVDILSDARPNEFADAHDEGHEDACAGRHAQTGYRHEEATLATAGAAIGWKRSQY